MVKHSTEKKLFIKQYILKKVIIDKTPSCTASKNCVTILGLRMFISFCKEDPIFVNFIFAEVVSQIQANHYEDSDFLSKVIWSEDFSLLSDTSVIQMLLLKTEASIIFNNNFAKKKK
jgi:hypothetical protein